VELTYLCLGELLGCQLLVVEESVLRRRRTHFEAPFPRAAANIKYALRALERRKHISLAKERLYDGMLHVESFIFGLCRIWSAADESGRAKASVPRRWETDMLCTCQRVVSRDIMAMLTSGHISVVCSAMVVHIIPYTRRERLRFPASRQQAGTAYKLEGATDDSKSAISDVGSD
jgi:hypothetical protein